MKLNEVFEVEGIALNGDVFADMLKGYGVEFHRYTDTEECYHGGDDYLCRYDYFVLEKHTVCFEMYSDNTQKIVVVRTESEVEWKHRMFVNYGVFKRQY